MIAIARLDSDDLQILRDAKRERVARARPDQLAERTKLVDTLTLTPAALKSAAALATAVATAQRDVDPHSAPWIAHAISSAMPGAVSTPIRTVSTGTTRAPAPAFARAPILPSASFTKP